MSWLWATADRSGLVVPAGAISDGYVAFLNGGTEAELWGRTYRAGPDAERSAATEFLATAYASVSAADPAPGAAVAVLGEGLLAHLIRGLLPDLSPGERDVVIDTTGSPDCIRRAVATLARLGHLVLAAPPRTADIDLATYQDLHVRALTVTGVGWVSDPSDAVMGDGAVNAALERLVRGSPGRPAQAGAWYAVHGGEPA
ncbi:MAG: hypothetical protein ACRDT4_06550 [Micromonosporaceae bacterium]